MRHILTLVVVLASPALAAPSLEVSKAWMRALPPGQPTAAAYMTLRNTGAEPLRLVAASSPIARSVEMHESSQVQGMWRMRQLDHISLGADEQIVLAPGGAHLMLFGVKSSPQAGDKVEITLTLENGESVAVTASVGEPDAGGHQHH